MYCIVCCTVPKLLPGKIKKCIYIFIYTHTYIIVLYAQEQGMPPSFLVLVDTTTQSPWLRVWTAACLVLQDTTVRRRGWPRCLENARPVRNSVFFYFLLKMQSKPCRLVSQCQDFVLCASLFVSRGWQASPKQSRRLVGREQRVHIKHGESQLNTSQICHYITSPVSTVLL